MKNVIGLDIGGTKITGIVFDGKKVLRQITIVTPGHLKDFKDALEKLVNFLAYGRHIAGVGIGVAGIVNQERGVVQYSPNIKYLQTFSFKQFFTLLGYSNIIVENDANCFAFAEAYFGKGKKFKHMVGITMGTGIGSGLIARGQIYRGSHGSAGEAGHVLADFKYDTEHYFQQARDKKDFKFMGEVLGNLLANILNLLDVDGIVLGGSVASKHNKQFLPFALEHAKRHIINKTIKPKVLISTIKNAGAIGAALLLKD
jgi:glucokinase